jgi:hypothetical protein
MRDQDVLLNVVFEMKEIVDRYVEVGSCYPEIAMDRLVELFERQELVIVIDRLERGFGSLRASNETARS